MGIWKMLNHGWVLSLFSLSLSFAHIQNPTPTPNRKKSKAQLVGPWHPCRRPILNAWLLASALPSLEYSEHFKSEQADGRDLYFSPSFTSSFSHSAFQMDE